MQQKNALKSWTLWINLIILIIALFDKQFFEIIGINEHATNIILALSVKVIAILNLVLRFFFTNSAVSFSSQSNIGPGTVGTSGGNHGGNGGTKKN